MKDTKYFYDYLNNENPFAFLKGYDKNKFLEDKTRKRLESIQKIQPKFIPCSMDPNVLSTEHNNTMNIVIKNGINKDINKGLDLLKKHNVEYDQSVFHQSESKRSKDMSLFYDIGYNKEYQEYNFNLMNLENILEVLKRYSHLGDMEDIIIDIYRLKLLNKQNIIRNKVYEALRERVDDEAIAGIDFDKPVKENSLEEAKRLIELEDKKRSDK